MVVGSGKRASWGRNRVEWWRRLDRRLSVRRTLLLVILWKEGCGALVLGREQRGQELA